MSAATDRLLGRRHLFRNIYLMADGRLMAMQADDTLRPAARSDRIAISDTGIHDGSRYPRA